MNVPLRVLLIGVAAAAIAAGCSSAPMPPEPPDPQLVTLADDAYLAFRAGSIAKAEGFYRRALDRARAMDRAGLIGEQAYNLAVCLIETNRYGEAEIALREAMAEEARRGGDPADLMVALAKLAYRKGDREEAEAEADRIIRHAGTKPGDAHLIEAYLLKARIALDAGDAASARAALAAAEPLAGDPPLPHRVAALAGVRGRILLAEGKPAEAAPEFDREGDALRGAGRYPEMASAIERAGDAYARAGRFGPAADRLYRAGRALAGQGRGEPALAILARAIEAAEKAGDSGLRIRAAALEAELEGELEAERKGP
ncbi:MAG: tetratricopeptide repeat protein [Planctomycetes bacterium]|nr:tetratricopeptide repeat protein [Planctomycetota bacterium]